MKHKNLLTLLAGVLAGILYIMGGNMVTERYWPVDRDGTETAQTASVTPGELKGRRILIAYYSWSGTTKGVAEGIQKEVGGDLYVIEPSESYAGSHGEVSKRAKKEQDEKYRPKLKNPLPDMERYDVVFLGYPIWWYQEPMVVDSFLEKNRWEGKIVVPFCTSGGSTIDRSVGNIIRETPGATVLKGITLVNGRGQDVKEWLVSNGF